MFSLSIMVYPSPSSQGILEGLNLCYNVIIPSLFPFTVVSLMLFDGNYINTLSRLINKASLKVFKVNGKQFCIYLVSLIGGYPVGAKLVENAYIKGEISKRNAEIMLAYSVNSGPSFIIIAVGTQILQNKNIGVILFSANLIASLIMAILLGRFISPQINTPDTVNNSLTFSDQLVKSTYDACHTMFSICAFVLVFSSITKIIKSIFNYNIISKIFCNFLEVTNGVAESDGNIIIISFLLGFAGVCVHFQILSICKTLKPRYSLFCLARLLHGALSAGITFILLKIFSLSITVSANSQVVSFELSKYSLYFGVLMIFASIVFMASIKKTLKLR